MADNNTIARPYAEAVFALARETGLLDAWSDALQTASELMGDGRIAEFLGNPKLSDEERLGFLTDLFHAVGGEHSIFAGDSLHGSNFLKILLEYDRIEVLPEIAMHFNELKARTDNAVDVTVTSASALSDTQKQSLATALEKRLGSTVRLTTELDQSLIGGAVIRAGDVVIDGSLRSRLQGLSNALVA